MTDAAPRAALAATFIRFLLVGAANTAVGFGVILALQFGLGAGPHLANAGGYAVGLIVSFALNRRFVFGRGGPTGRAATRFAAAALGAFALNQLVLLGAGRLFGPGALPAAAAQAMAVASYTAALFALCRWWVFQGPAAADAGEGRGSG
jgi:putative flippase GtrA